MKKVFIGGSRNISRLNKDVKIRLNNIMEQDFTILVGDANGADKSVQKYCLEKTYRNVIVFCSGNHCRNNLGNWQTNTVITPSDAKGFDFYVAKDLELANEADYGFMIWDLKSNGTLNNILNLLHLSKCTLVYFAPEHHFEKIKNKEDLEAVLTKCASTDLQQFEKKLKLSSKLAKLSQPHQPSLI